MGQFMSEGQLQCEAQLMPQVALQALEGICENQLLPLMQISALQVNRSFLG